MVNLEIGIHVSEDHNGIIIKFNPNYLENWISAADRVTRYNSIESSVRTPTVISVQFTCKMNWKWCKTKMIQRKRRILLEKVHKFNHKFVDTETVTNLRRDS